MNRYRINSIFGFCHYYDDAMQNNNEKLKARNQGRYAAMFDLLHELEIYEKEET